MKLKKKFIQKRNRNLQFSYLTPTYKVYLQINLKLGSQYPYNLFGKY